GGVLAAIIGPELLKYTKDLAAPIPFMGAIITLALVNVVALVLVSFIKIPKAKEEDFKDSGRPLAEIMKQPVFIVAVISGMVGYSVMILIMTASPIAAIACVFEVEDAAFLIQWHALAMFAPGFFTGNLINKFGVLNVIRFGAVLLAICVGISLSGLEIENFWGGLVLLGLGWNFTFVGGTTLLTSCYSPRERNKVQAANDFLVFSAAALASFASGGILQIYGWNMVNITALPAIFLAFLAVTYLAGKRREEAHSV
ncbi:MAG: MFS transporter, partial [Amylibacter sp.]